MAGQIASQGQAQSQMLGAQETAAIQEKNSMRKQQQLVRRTVREELRQLKKDKGAAKSTYLSEAREGERRYDLGKRELKQSKGGMKQQRQADQRGNKLTRSENRKNRDFDREQAAKDQKGDSGGDGNITDALRKTKGSKAYEALQAGREIKENGKLGKPRSRASFIQSLTAALQDDYGRAKAKKAATAWVKRHYKQKSGSGGQDQKPVGSHGTSGYGG